MVESSDIEEKNAFAFGLHKNNLAIATTGSLINALTVNLQAIKIGTGQIMIHNQTAGDLDYVILGTYADAATIVAPTATDDDDDGWIQIAAASIATTVSPVEIAITKGYSQVVVQIKHTTLTTNVDIWFRASNV